jgi:peptide/nickel transport system substrate-binding protein
MMRVGRALLVLMVGVLAACSFSGQADSRDVVVLGVQGEPDTLNPILGYAPDGPSKIFDGLLTRHSTG